ncbi:MAG: hypothetical protein FJ095_03360 [Deltaproteobacteria bacterium]|nr:hypothetical protein [Deltaproteobacteria bacterium]
MNANPEVAPSLANFRETLSTMDVAGRDAAIAKLAASTDAHPDAAEAWLLLGLGHLWSVAEPPSDIDLATIGATAFKAKEELEKAYELCPTDHRIPAWLGPIGARMGETLKNEAMFDEAIAVLDKGIEEYRAFVLFSRMLVFANRPKTDSDFQQALSAVVDNIGACEAAPTDSSLHLILDPACNNSPHAYHNIEGSSVFLGDVFAKAGRKEDALASYSFGKLAPNYADWKWKSLLDERIAGLDERVAAYDTDAPKDEAWNRNDQCVLCHAK